ncbi:MAG: hypothetical protein JXQ96_15110 [Cyclobacteriaceae bacterium]
MIKKITLIALACLVPAVTWAHDVIVPHVHQDFKENTLVFTIVAVLAVIVGIGAVKHYRNSNASDESKLR